MTRKKDDKDPAPSVAELQLAHVEAVKHLAALKQATPRSDAAIHTQKLEIQRLAEAISHAETAGTTT